MVDEVDPTHPVPPSENLKREIAWTRSNFRVVALSDKRFWARFAAVGQITAVSAGFLAAIFVALSKTSYTNSVIDVLSIALPVLGSAASAVLLQTKAAEKQRSYEFAWQEYDHLLSSVDQMIADAKGRGLSAQAYEAECSLIAKQLVDGRRDIERRLIG